MSQHFLTPFVVTTHRAFGRVEDQVRDDHLSRSAARALAEEVRAALSTLLQYDDVPRVLIAARLVAEAERRCVQLPYGRALAVVMAPADPLVVPATMESLYRRTDEDGIPCGGAVVRYTYHRRNVGPARVRPLP